MTSMLQTITGPIAMIRTVGAPIKRSFAKVRMPQPNSATPSPTRTIATGRGEPTTIARWISPAPIAAKPSHVRVICDMVAFLLRV